ncbi:MAG TPA: DinB family protein [Terriglobales bacterium]|nr:DinB family protein [Terriglobales bacterium]
MSRKRTQCLCYHGAMTNPYAPNLAGKDPVKVISETANHLERLSKTIGPKRIDQPRAPGKWSAREILCHLADCETVFAFRIRQTLAEDRHVIQPFDQDKWAQNYSGCSPAEALALFSSLRSWNVKLVKKLPKEALSKKVSHPERGEMTLQTIIETMGGHDLNHLKQLEEIASKKAAAS